MATVIITISPVTITLQAHQQAENEILDSDDDDEDDMDDDMDDDMEEEMEEEEEEEEEDDDDSYDYDEQADIHHSDYEDVDMQIIQDLYPINPQQIPLGNVLIDNFDDDDINDNNNALNEIVDIEAILIHDDVEEEEDGEEEEEDDGPSIEHAAMQHIMEAIAPDEMHEYMINYDGDMLNEQGVANISDEEEEDMEDEEMEDISLLIQQSIDDMVDSGGKYTYSQLKCQFQCFVFYI